LLILQLEKQSTFTLINAKTITMRKGILFISLFFLSNSIFASSDSLVKTIRKKYAGINSIVPKCKKVKKDIWGESVEGGEVNGYYDGNDLKLAVVHLFGESYQIISEYYFDRGEIIFVYERVIHYNCPFYIDSLAAKEMGSKIFFDFAKSKVEEQRSYFYKGKMIRWINELKKDVPSTLEEYANKQDADLQYVITLRTRLEK
jgi:hypothetical protein